MLVNIKYIYDFIYIYIYNIKKYCVSGTCRSESCVFAGPIT